MSNFIAGILAFITFLQAMLGIGGIKDVGGFDKNDWLKNISSDKYISEISLPGTHNSGALYEPAYGTAKCQKYSVTDQLNMGVRFLDIRAGFSAGKLKIKHGPLSQSMTFDKFTELCYKFLEENPSETIVFSLRNEDMKSEQRFDRLLSSEINDNADRWFTEDRIPTLGEVRGKIMLINRFDSDCALGINAAHDWKNNDTFNIAGTEYCIWIQDRYSVDSIDEKKQYVNDFFNTCRYIEDGKNNIYISFLSVAFQSGSIPTVSNEMNNYFIDYSKDFSGFYGWVLFDYVTPELCNAVISAN